MAIGSLADGQLATSKTTIYTVPDLSYACIEFASFFNTNAASQTILLYVKRSGGTSRVIGRVVLAQNEHAWLVDQAISSLRLSAGDIIEAQTTTAEAVDFLICGIVGVV